MNAVSGSLLRAPDFKNKSDATRVGMVAMATRVSEYEPEFVLKVRKMKLIIIIPYTLKFSDNYFSTIPDHEAKLFKTL